ncbi:MAG: GNAT family N-acetyltransferase [Erysipelotrichaceae bacterium]|nr:GNAT family N-acetyltransferase [Erysipelotrichaceae bacterium]
MTIRVVQKPENVPLQDLLDVMHKAHDAAKTDKLNFPVLTLEKLSKLVDTGSVCFVAMDEDTVVGTIVCEPQIIDKWYAKGNVMAWRGIAVLPEYKGHHIARQLYDAAVEYAKTQNVEICYMTMSEFNEHHLHVATKYGFQLVEYVTHRKLAHSSNRVAYWIHGCPFTEKEIKKQYRNSYLQAKWEKLTGKKGG